MSSLKGKTVVVTGGTAGIGKEIAALFVQEGAHVVIFGTNAERAQEALDYLNSVRSNGEQKILSKLVDVSSKSAVDEAMSAVLTEFGMIDVLVNNAGITKDQLLMKMTESDWDLVLDTNLKSVYNTCSCVVRPMLKAKSGKIINISSVVGLIGNPGQTNYAAAKAGMIGFTKALAQEVASRGICVNCVAPGFIQTKMTDVLSEEQRAAILQKVPMKRLGRAQEIAQAVLFLAMADYITGQVLTVDGGMVM